MENKTLQNKPPRKNTHTRVAYDGSMGSLELSRLGSTPSTLINCKKCNYEWFARKEKPRQCPNCKRQIK